MCGWRWLFQSILSGSMKVLVLDHGIRALDGVRAICEQFLQLLAIAAGNGSGAKGSSLAVFWSEAGVSFVFMFLQRCLSISFVLS